MADVIKLPKRCEKTVLLNEEGLLTCDCDETWERHDGVLWYDSGDSYNSYAYPSQSWYAYYTEDYTFKNGNINGTHRRDFRKFYLINHDFNILRDYNAVGLYYLNYITIYIHLTEEWNGDTLKGKGTKDNPYTCIPETDVLYEPSTYRDPRRPLLTTGILIKVTGTLTNATNLGNLPLFNPRTETDVREERSIWFDFTDCVNTLNAITWEIKRPYENVGFYNIHNITFDMPKGRVTNVICAKCNNINITERITNNVKMIVYESTNITASVVDTRNYYALNFMSCSDINVASKDISPEINERYYFNVLFASCNNINIDVGKYVDDCYIEIGNVTKLTLKIYYEIYLNFNSMQRTPEQYPANGQGPGLPSDGSADWENTDIKIIAQRMTTEDIAAIIGEEQPSIDDIAYFVQYASWKLDCHTTNALTIDVLPPSEISESVNGNDNNNEAQDDQYELKYLNFDGEPLIKKLALFACDSFISINNVYISFYGARITRSTIAATEYLTQHVTSLIKYEHAYIAESVCDLVYYRSRYAFYDEPGDLTFYNPKAPVLCFAYPYGYYVFSLVPPYYNNESGSYEESIFNISLKFIPVDKLCGLRVGYIVTSQAELWDKVYDDEGHRLGWAEGVKIKNEHDDYEHGNIFNLALYVQPRDDERTIPTFCVVDNHNLITLTAVDGDMDLLTDTSIESLHAHAVEKLKADCKSCSVEVVARD